MKRTGKQKFYAALIVVIAAAILVIVVSWLIRGGSQQVAEQVPVPPSVRPVSRPLPFSR